MPYGRRATYGRKRKYARKPYRKTSVKRRSYGRTSYRKRPTMTKKSILNTTSRKKRDTLLTVSNTTAAAATKPLAVGPLYVSGTGNYFGVWAATGRDLVQYGGGSNTVVQESQRTSTVAYMRGLSEKIRIQTSSGVPWLWRRICFKYRGSSVPFNAAATSDTGQAQPYVAVTETSSGYGRLYLNQFINGMGNTLSAEQAILFKGRQGNDWQDLLTAPVDTRRVDLASDKTYKISSGNANGILREYKTWYPMNKNLVYDDDENGETEETSLWSVDDKRGMGDYYICDIIIAGTGATASDVLQLTSTTSLYWHEK